MNSCCPQEKTISKIRELLLPAVVVPFVVQREGQMGYVEAIKAIWWFTIMCTFQSVLNFKKNNQWILKRSSKIR